jgi:hypothetical protein
MASAKFCMFCGVPTTDGRGACPKCRISENDTKFMKGDRVRLTAVGQERFGLQKYRGRIGTIVKRPNRGASTVFVQWDGVRVPDRICRENLEFVPPDSKSVKICARCGYPVSAAIAVGPVGKGTVNDIFGQPP